MRLEALRNNYDLLEAFEALGEWLYGHEWTGDEKWRDASHVTDPDILQKKHDEILNQRELLDAKRDALMDQKARSLNGEEIEELKAQIEKVWAQLSKIGDVLYQNQAPTKGTINDWEAWQRKQKIEKTLVDGFAKDQIRAIGTGGRVIEDYLWKGKEKGFQYHINLGIVILPKLTSSRKRHTVRIAQPEFDEWLRTITPINPAELEKLTDGQRCEIWLRDLVKIGEQSKPKNEIFEGAKAHISGLSRRAFDAAWINVVPTSWKKHGRRSWND